MNRKRTKNVLTFRSRDLNPRFSAIFPPMIWIFMESEESEIKSKQASKRDRTLLKMKFYVLFCTRLYRAFYIHELPTRPLKEHTSFYHRKQDTLLRKWGNGIKPLWCHIYNLHIWFHGFYWFVRDHILFFKTVISPVVIIIWLKFLTEPFLQKLFFLFPKILKFK